MVDRSNSAVKVRDGSWAANLVGYIQRACIARVQCTKTKQACNTSLAILSPGPSLGPRIFSYACLLVIEHFLEHWTRAIIQATRAAAEDPSLRRYDETLADDVHTHDE